MQTRASQTAVCTWIEVPFLPVRKPEEKANLLVCLCLVVYLLALGRGGRNHEFGLGPVRKILQ